MTAIRNHFVFLSLLILALPWRIETDDNLWRREKSIRVFNLYFVVNFDLYQEMKAKSLSVVKRIESIMKIVNKIYAPLYIQFRVVQIDVWAIPIIINLSEHHLPSELKYYKSKLTKTYHDCLHLFIKPMFAMKRDGYGEKLSMCSRSSCIGYTVDSSNNRVIDTAYVMSHELGHNFGINHDNSNCGCMSCIMATGIEISGRKMKWSQCSVKEIASIIDHGYPSCTPANFKSKSVQLITVDDRWSRNRFTSINISLNLSYCGNGIIEENEDCDCLEKNGCDNCCNITSCRFKEKATCASGPCCNDLLCEVMKKGYVCRSAVDSCDLPGYCDGDSEQCSITYKMDMLPCITKFNESGFCLKGKCQNHLDQCRLLWGDTSIVSHFDCYQENRARDHKFKNCGEIRSENENSEYHINEKYNSCSYGDELCGRLWCDHQNERLMILGISETFSFTVNNHFCQAAKFELNWDSKDIGMVRNGATCGIKKICYNSRCIDIDTNVCDCNGNGICDNHGKCHCNKGYLPPNCSHFPLVDTTTESYSSSTTMNGTVVANFTSSPQIYSIIHTTKSCKSGFNLEKYLLIVFLTIITLAFFVMLLVKITKVLFSNRKIISTSTQIKSHCDDTVKKITFSDVFFQSARAKERNKNENILIIRKINEPEYEKKHHLIRK